MENLHRIGDCVAPRKLDHAIYEGYLAGRELWSPEERYIYEGELERWEEATVGGRRVGERRCGRRSYGVGGGAHAIPQAIFSHDVRERVVERRRRRRSRRPRRR